MRAKQLDKFSDGLDAYNQIEQDWAGLVERSFKAKYAGYSYDGQKINPGDTISRLFNGKYIIIIEKPYNS